MGAMEDFNQFIDFCGLMEIPPDGGEPYSWCNGQTGWTRSWAKLDRLLYDSNCLEKFPNLHMRYLARTTSDHAPMLIWLQPNMVRYGPTPFKFQQMWTTHESFKECVLKIWEGNSGESGLWRLAGKLKRLRTALRIWNKEVFGWTGEHIQRLEKELEELDASLQVDHSEEIEYTYLATKVELETLGEREGMRLAQIAKQSWIEKGEASNQFFKQFNGRTSYRVKEMRLRDGTVLDNHEAIHHAAVDYFQNFLGAGPRRDQPDLSAWIQQTISEAENEEFGRLPSPQEEMLANHYAQTKLSCLRTILSEFPRLNYGGFYTVVLEKDAIVMSVASIRIHGVNVAELPLVATSSNYRRKGLCRLLIDSIEEDQKMLQLQEQMNLDLLTLRICNHVSNKIPVFRLMNNRAYDYDQARSVCSKSQD
ncbi:unnamed protein product [Fraxinus pennsylvanica]|uniref:Increased DNA methylation 1 C-terminal domain-containing protein n=1 Tax=Fraxinus pennsylvanica TaxID=56036 RepID=A0AAD1ZKY4_9LAMI|nr:unnamed protein product [Fraxinus pennsylvanica]